MSEEKRVPDILVEQLALGELPPGRAEEVRRRLEREPGGMGRLSALSASNEDILRTHPPARVAEEVERRGEKLVGERVRRRRWTAVPSLAIAAAAAVFLFWFAGNPDGVRLKGTPMLFVDRQTAQGSERLSHGDTASEGDVLQVSYRASGAKYGAILSIDGRGAVTHHFPSTGTQAARLEEGKRVHLPRSYELDDAPESERFCFVTSDEPFDLTEALGILVTKTTLPEGYAATYLELKKSAR